MQALARGSMALAATQATGTAAGIWRRFFASLIDWLTCLLVPLVLAGAFVPSFWVVIVPLSVLTYFGVSFVRGQTPGMRAASIRIVDQRRGRPPTAVTALARSLVCLLQAAAVFALFVFVFSDTPDRGYTAFDVALLTASSALAFIALVCHLWMFADSGRRTVLDRLFGLEIAR